MREKNCLKRPRKIVCARTGRFTKNGLRRIWPEPNRRREPSAFLLLTYVHMLPICAHMLLCLGPRNIAEVIMRLVIATLLALPLTFATAQGEPLKPGTAITANFGNLSIITYYTRKTDGLHVVSTARVGDSDCAPVFRVTSVLLPDQEVVISIPQPLGAEPLELRLVREGDTIRQVPAQIDILGAAD